MLMYSQLSLPPRSHAHNLSLSPAQMFMAKEKIHEFSISFMRWIEARRAAAQTEEMRRARRIDI
jgi:hypothetical protein